MSESAPAPQSRVFHVAIADDWEAAVPFGSYEAATRGMILGVGQPIRTTSAARLQHVLDGPIPPGDPSVVVRVVPVTRVDDRWVAPELA